MQQSKSPNKKIRSAWALRLDKSDSQIWRLIEAGKIPNRYPLPNEGPPVPKELRGKIPVPRNYKEYNVGQRKRASKKTVLGRVMGGFDKVLGTSGSERERIAHNVEAVLDDRCLTKNDAETFRVTYGVMAKALRRPKDLEEIILAEIERLRGGELSPLEKEKAVFITERIRKLSARDIGLVKKLLNVVERLYRQKEQGLDPNWTKAEVAYRMKVSKSCLEDLIQRADLIDIFQRFAQGRRKFVTLLPTAKDLYNKDEREDPNEEEQE
jgi:hypothetical protein